MVGSPSSLILSQDRMPEAVSIMCTRPHPCVPPLGRHSLPCRLFADHSPGRISPPLRLTLAWGFQTERPPGLGPQPHGQTSEVTGPWGLGQLASGPDQLSPVSVSVGRNPCIPLPRFPELEIQVFVMKSPAFKSWQPVGV